MQRDSSAVAEQDRILGAITLPEEFEPVRYCDEFSSQRTSLAKVVERKQVSWQSQQATNLQQLKPGEQFVAIRGDNPLCAALVSDPNPTGQTCSYDWTDGGSTALYVQNGGFLHTSWAVPHVGTVYKPHGPQLFSEEHDGVRFVWGDGTPGSPNTIAVTMPNPGATAGKIILWRLNAYDPQIVSAQSLTSGQATYTFTPNFSDAFAVQFVGTPTAAIAGAVNVTQSTTSSILQHLAVEQFFQNSNYVAECRVLAHAVRMTDIAAPLNAEGYIAIAELDQPGEWYEIFTQGVGQNSLGAIIADYDDAYADKLITGGYTYCKPSSRTAWDMQQFVYSSFESNIVYDAAYMSANPNAWKIIVAYTLNTGNNAASGLGADAMLTFSTHIEYVTPNKWIGKDRSRFSREQWGNALEKLKWAPDATENEFHWSDLIKWVGTAAQIAAPILAATPLAAASPFVFQAGALANSIADELNPGPEQIVSQPRRNGGRGGGRGGGKRQRQ